MSQQTKKSKKDPRDIITPDAFAVDEKLLGLPLATPKRRGLAMLIDLLLIQQLSHVDSVVLGLAIAVVLFLLSSTKGKNTVGSIRKNIFKVLALFLLIYIILAESLSYFETNNNNNNSVVETDTPSIEQIEDKVAIIAPRPSSLSITEQLAEAKEEIAQLNADKHAQTEIIKSGLIDNDLMDIIEAIAEKFGYGFGWAGVYFTLFCFLLNGQTPGKFILRIRIIQLDGKKLSIWNAFGRYGGYAASVVTGLSGFFQIYWDANRQGLHDKVSGTVVIKL